MLSTCPKFQPKIPPLSLSLTQNIFKTHTDIGTHRPGRHAMELYCQRVPWTYFLWSPDKLKIWECNAFSHSFSLSLSLSLTHIHTHTNTHTSAWRHTRMETHKQPTWENLRYHDMLLYMRGQLMWVWWEKLQSRQNINFRQYRQYLEIEIFSESAHMRTR
jgi:hypothetical protein